MEGKKKIPFWVPELLRLQHKNHLDMIREMNMRPVRLQLGLFDAQIISFPKRVSVAPQTTAATAESLKERLQTNDLLRESA